MKSREKHEYKERRLSSRRQSSKDKFHGGCNPANGQGRAGRGDGQPRPEGQGVRVLWGSRTPPLQVPQEGLEMQHLPPEDTPVRDERGRVRTLVEDRPGSHRVTTHKDRKTTGRVETRQAVLQFFQDMAAQRAGKAKERRKAAQAEKDKGLTDEQRKAAEKKRKRERDPLQIGALMKELAWDAESDTDSEGTASAAMAAVQVASLKKALEAEGIVVHLDVDGHQVKAVCDSGALFPRGNKKSERSPHPPLASANSSRFLVLEFSSKAT